jgi:RHS repeat-associated protein
VRRVFASTTSAQAYRYDPYGVPLQATAPTTDFVYAGMFYNADSGLYLTKYRAFDPFGGRWLSRDPLGETTNAVGNLYPYVDGNPVALIDPDGRSPVLVAPFVIIGGALIGAYIVGKAIGDTINQMTKPEARNAIEDTISEMAKGGKQNIRDTGLIGVSDEEIERRLKDPGISSKEKRRLEKEQKARKTRHSSQKMDLPDECP